MFGFFLGALLFSGCGCGCGCGDGCGGCSYSCGGCWRWSWCGSSCCSPCGSSCCSSCCTPCWSYCWYGCGDPYACGTCCNGDATAGYETAARNTLPPNQALIVVDLPAGAALYVNGSKIDLASSKRQVLTPALEASRSYTYTVKTAEVRDGRTVEKTKTVAFRAGQVVTVNMTDPVVSRFTVRLPEDARLTVDGKACNLTSAVRTFTVPDLKPGETYHYTLKAEVVRDGKKHEESRHVVFEGGKPVEVSFGTAAPVLTARR